MTGIISEEKKTNVPPCWKITKMKYNLQFYNRVSPFHFEKSVECCGSTSSYFQSAVAILLPHHYCTIIGAYYATPVWLGKFVDGMG